MELSGKIERYAVSSARSPSCDVAERIFDHEQERSILSGSYLETFIGNEDKAEVQEKQDHFLTILVERRSKDSNLMALVFDAISRLRPERRRRLLSLFLERNSNFEDFLGLPLQPSGYSWTGSAVPVLRDRAEYLESLLPLLNTVELLRHKQHVELLIQRIRSDAELEKKEDFLRE